MDRSDIAVVIPAWNAEATLGRAIESALRQTRAAGAVVVVDDGSSDGTAAAAEAFGDLVTVVRRSTPSGGPGAPRNSGARAVSATRLIFLDADDELAPNAIELHSDVVGDVTFGDCVVRDEAGNEELATARFGVLDDPLMLITGNFIPVHAACVTREWFYRVGGFDERRGLAATEDWHFWLKIALSGGTFVRMEQAVGVYHLQPISLSLGGDRFGIARMAMLDDLAERYPAYRAPLLARRRHAQSELGLFYLDQVAHRRGRHHARTWLRGVRHAGLSRAAVGMAFAGIVGWNAADRLVGGFRRTSRSPVR